MTKKCGRCQTFKDTKYFFSNVAQRDGFHNYCRPCESEYRKLPHIRASNRKSIMRYRSTLEGHLKQIVLSARKSARKRNLKFNLTYEIILDIWKKQDGKCALSGEEMSHIKGKRHQATNCSVDKIDPRKHYTLDNVQLVTYRFNKVKTDLTMEELTTFCENFLDRHKK